MTESHVFQWEHPPAAPSAGPQKLLFIKCCDASTHTQSVQKKRSLTPEERAAFWGNQWWCGGKKSSQRFVALSDDLFYLVRDIGIADSWFSDSLRDVLGTLCIQGAIGAASLSLYNAERSSLSSLSVWTQRRRTLSNLFHGLTDWLLGLWFLIFFNNKDFFFLCRG